MQNFEYQHDSDNLEIFPRELWKNPMIVFHGTTTYHSDSIEKNGLIVNTTPYNIEYAKVLIQFLKTDKISKFDKEKGFFKCTTANKIQHYLDAIEKKEFRLSFSPLSSSCVTYTLSETKGGQAFRDIRESKQIIDTAIKSNNSIEKIIPLEVKNLFLELEKVNKSQGVVYAIKLPENLDGIECDMNNVIYSSKSIHPELIIGKVLVPDYPVELNTDPNQIKLKIKSKLYGDGGLHIIIWKKQN